MAWFLSRIKWCDSENDQDEVESFPQLLRSQCDGCAISFDNVPCLVLMTASFPSAKKPLGERAPFSSGSRAALAGHDDFRDAVFG
jgi:hypothetical protein